ncbi:hypothetical protein [Mycolicibacterium sp. P9-22]|uniref:hypothetical protein n=1 Tax=Mycolicibacterium sp. P9-22 TaxID=2024613 RepID=UPI001883F56C|nr:hypothetical protein [Mycolicibacterium sp. P9-22]
MAPPGPAPAPAPGTLAVAPPGPAPAPGAGAGAGGDDGASVVVAAPVDGVVVIVDSVVVVDVSVEFPLSELHAVSPPANTAPATAAARGKRRTI